MRPFPIYRVRREFPALVRLHNGRHRVFLGNPARTQLRRRIINPVANALVQAGSKATRVTPVVVPHPKRDLLLGTTRSIARQVGWI